MLRFGPSKESHPPSSDTENSLVLFDLHLNAAGVAVLPYVQSLCLTKGTTKRMACLREDHGHGHGHVLISLIVFEINKKTLL